MKASYKILSVFMAGLLMAGVVNAQQGLVHVNLNYSINTPTGDFKDVVNKTSYRSFTANVLYGVSDQLSVGLGTGYLDFYQKYPRQVYKLQDGGDVSAVLSNSVQAIPLLATAQYNFLPNAVVQPYVGVGVGGNIILYRQYLGEFGESYSKFGFAARPEAGVYVPFRKGGASGITLRADYNYMPVTVNDLRGMSNWGAGIGVKFPLQ